MSSLVLLMCLCAHITWGVSSDTLVVKQTPDVSFTLGKAVNISCCWIGEFDRATVDWTKNQISLKRELFSNIKPKKPSGCSYLTFQKIERADSGRYVCNVTVELPDLLKVKGDGTVITVTANKERKGNTNANKDNARVEESPSEEVWINLLRCLPLLTLIISFYCIIKLESKTQHQTQDAPGKSIPLTQRVEEEEEKEEKKEEKEREAEEREEEDVQQEGGHAEEKIEENTK